MAKYNIYFSPTGGTKKVADIIADGLNGGFREIDLCHQIETLTLSHDDICIVSVPSYGGRVPSLAIQRIQCISGHGAKAVLICAYGNRAWDDTLTELQDTLESQGFVCLAALAAVTEHSLFRQYATGRPDSQDREDLEEMASMISNRLNNPKTGTLKLEGKHFEYKPFGGSPLKPTADDKCTGCGLCAQECPAGAISRNTLKDVDETLCISCMRCISICPHNARHIDIQTWNAVNQRIGPALSGRKENHLFIAES